MDPDHRTFPPAILHLLKNTVVVKLVNINHLFLLGLLCILTRGWLSFTIGSHISYFNKLGKFTSFPPCLEKKIGKGKRNRNPTFLYGEKEKKSGTETLMFLGNKRALYDESVGFPLYEGILLSSEKKQTLDLHNICELQKNCAKSKKSEIKGHILCDSIYMK